MRAFLKILAVTLPFAILACGERGVSQPQESAKAKSPQPIDFNRLHTQVEAFNTRDLEFFKTNWPSVRKELHRYATQGRFKTLSQEDQKKLWYELEYLRGCRHPSILHKYGDEILRILYALDYPEGNNFLRDLEARARRDHDQ